jgi:membrane associated rhomboid family serine protease
MHQDSDAIISAYGASAQDILRGEFFRCVTALMLHGDLLHLVSNMFGVAIFGTAVCAFTGVGVGWVSILFAGLVGNLLNAFLYQTDHLSIGASTAVFGAIGFLGAYQFIHKFRQPGQRLKAYLPLGAGLALLGFLGAGAGSDLTAHLFGFVVGGVLGGLYGRWVQKPLEPPVQRGFMAVAVAITLFAWLKAF